MSHFEIHVIIKVPFHITVPIIPEFLYTIRHQYDTTIAPPPTTTTTTTRAPQTPWGYNETYYDVDPAIGKVVRNRLVAEN